MDKALTALIAVAIGFAMFVAFAGMAEAAEPTPEYTCPICELQFLTYDELYQHFVTGHPAEDIEIIWE